MDSVTSSAPAPAPKKPKLDINAIISVAQPSIHSGVLSASASAARESEAKPLKIPFERLHEPSSFFENSGDIEDKCEIDKDLLSQWDDDEYLEDDVRNDIYQQFKSSGFLFPADSGEEEYSEKYLRTIFVEYAKKNKHEIKTLSDSEQGLRVTLSSRPDLCVLQDDNIIVGEVKQLNYTTRKAADQASLYILAVLYFFRVTLGFPVDVAYGFWLCGPNCSDLKKGEYAVGLLRVVAPRKIGEPFRAYEWRETYKTTNVEGVKVLINFLKKGKKMELNPEGRISGEFRVPGRFALPSSLWRGGNGFEFVHNGTSAIVLKLQKGGLQNLLLQNVDGTGPAEKKKRRYIKELVASEPADTDEVYVKVQTKDTSQHYETPQIFQAVHAQILKAVEDDEIDAEEKDGLRDFLNTYIVGPYIGNQFVLFVMANRGDFCKGITVEFGYIDLGKKLAKLRKRIMVMTNYFDHGDALWHNIVFDGKDFHLIDYDEATVTDEENIPRRSIVYGSGQYPWFQAMMYPNALRHLGQLYTEVQFMTVAFVAAATLLEADNNAKLFVQSLGQDFMRLGNLLQTHGSTGNEWDKSSLPPVVSNIIAGFHEKLKIEWGEI